MDSVSREARVSLVDLLDGEKLLQLVVQIGLGHQLQPAAAPFQQQPALGAVQQMLLLHRGQHRFEFLDVRDAPETP